MAFFTFRKGADAPAPAPAESIEALRRRARYRLTGAAALVLAGIIGFPLLFDTQPRPIAVDIPIDIPDRNKVKPLGAPVSSGAVQVPAIADPVIAAAPPVAAPAPAPSTGQKNRMSEGSVGPGPERAAATGGAGDKPEARALAKADDKAEQRGAAGADRKAEPNADPKPARTPRPETEAQKAKALLEGRSGEPASAAVASAGESRFVVQVGAFADAAKAQDTRLKVERSGLKTYTHVAETKEGKRTRVRVGPFATRSEADEAAAKIKGLDLPAAVLTL